MYSNERFDIILEYLKNNKRASIQELNELLFVSEATIRRDLTEMQGLGLITRTHGGALYMEEAEEISVFVRQEKNAKDKELTASLALPHIPDFKTVFIDDSSTCLALASRMNFAYKTVITNSFQLVNHLVKRNNIHLILTGGEIEHNVSSATGALTCRMLRELHADLMLSSCAALSVDGAFELTSSVMQLKSVAMEISDQHLLIVDQNKISRKAIFCTSKLSAYDAIISNATDLQLAPFREKGIAIINK